MTTSSGEASWSGNAAATEDTQVDQLILTLHHCPWRLEVGGHIENDDVAMAMLQQAVRAYETRLRMANAAAMAERLKQEARDAEIARSVFGRR